VLRPRQRPLHPQTNNRRRASENIIMKRRRPKLYLVGQDPADVFDDLDQLRSDLKSPPQRRPKATETFARIPHDKALELHRRYKLGGPAWILLFELDRLILKHRGQNPVRLESNRLRAAGIYQHTRARALRRLEAAGVVRLERRKHGLAPWVMHLWYPPAD
jgi:hypothetical protein